MAVVAMLLAMVASALATPAADAKSKKHDLQHRQHQVQEQQKKAKGDLDESSAELRRATRSLAGAQRRLRTARAHLRHVNLRLVDARAAHTRIRRELTEMKSRLARARTDLADSRRSVGSERSKIQQTVLAQFYGSDPALVQVTTVLGGGNLADLTRSTDYSAGVTTSQTNTLQRLEAAKTLLTVHEQDVKDTTAKVADKEQEAADKVSQIRTLRTQAVTARNRVLDLVDRRRTATRQAAKAKAHDRRELARLKKQEDRIRKQILQLSRRGGNRRVAHTRGMFGSPVQNSYITSPYGWRKHPIYHYWGLHNGDDLHAPCGTPEHAIDTGRVISTYYSSVWGNRLYLYLGRINGHSYTAIYNHLSRYRAHVGQVVSRGQTLALAGTTGWSTACHLHFTIMRDGKAVNPSPLIGL